MKPINIISTSNQYLPPASRLFIRFVIAIAFFFTSCNEDLTDLKVDLRSSSLNTTLSNNNIYEAEEGLLNGVVVTTNQPGYTGTGFVDFVHATGDFIEWTVNTSSNGSFSLQFRYANGGASNRPLQLQVNGTLVDANLAFAPTGGWANWSIALSTVNLKSGVNKIRLTTTGYNGPNVDHLVMKPTVTQSETLEAETAVLNGAIVSATQTGFTGTGYADYVNTTGDYIEWTVNATATGSFLLKFRYANGATTNRPLQLEVNGSIITASLDFSPTGGWANWSLATATANLIAGTNKIRLITTGSNGPNVDNLNYNSGNTKHILYLVDNGLNKLLYINQKDPSKSWTIPIPSGSRDLQLVANNKILVSHGNGAAEYDRTTGVKGWSVSTYSGVSTAQRLANGNTLLGWARPASGTTPAKVMLSEVNSGGKEVSRVTINHITTFRLARRLLNGNTLITGDINNDLKFKVFEVNATGAIVWQQFLYGGKGYVANRLANGETQATMGPVGNLYQPGKDDNKVLQLNRTGAMVKFWGGMDNHPTAELRKFSGYSVVPSNGNILVANWLGDGNNGKGPHAVEFDANNNLIWSWKDFSAAQTVTNVLVIE